MRLGQAKRDLKARLERAGLVVDVPNVAPEQREGGITRRLVATEKGLRYADSWNDASGKPQCRLVRMGMLEERALMSRPEVQSAIDRLASDSTVLEPSVGWGMANHRLDAFRLRLENELGVKAHERKDGAVSRQGLHAYVRGPHGDTGMLLGLEWKGKRPRSVTIHVCDAGVGLARVDVPVDQLRQALFSEGMFGPGAGPMRVVGGGQFVPPAFARPSDGVSMAAVSSGELDLAFQIDGRRSQTYSLPSWSVKSLVGLLNEWDEAEARAGGALPAGLPQAAPAPRESNMDVRTVDGVAFWEAREPAIGDQQHPSREVEGLLGSGSAQWVQWTPPETDPNRNN